MERHAGSVNQLSGLQSRSCGLAAIRGVGLAIALSALPVAAASESRSYTLSDFDGVSASSGIHVFVDVGEDFSVTAESDEPQQLDRLELDVRRGTLRARMDKRVFSLRRTKGWKVTVYVSLPELNHANASSGTEIEIDAMAGGNLELIASSGAKLRVESLTGTSIDANASSGAQIAAGTGECNALDAAASSGAGLDLAEVECASVEVNASSGSTADVFANDRIDANASSGSTIRVYGAHDEIEINASSGGKVVFP